MPDFASRGVRAGWTVVLGEGAGLLGGEAVPGVRAGHCWGGGVMVWWMGRLAGSPRGEKWLIVSLEVVEEE